MTAILNNQTRLDAITQGAESHTAIDQTTQFIDYDGPLRPLTAAEKAQINKIALGLGSLPVGFTYGSPTQPEAVVHLTGDTVPPADW